jgi:DNA-binding CsgD family transcriptional regulator
MLTTQQLQGCLHIVNDALKAKTRDDVEVIWLEMQDFCGIDGLLLGVSETSLERDMAESTAIWFGIADAWLDIYRDKNFALIDPVVRMCMEEDRIIEWREAFDKYGAGAEEFIELAVKYGLSEGYAIGRACNSVTHTASIASVTFNPNVVTVAQHVLIQNILPHLNEIVTRPGFLRKPELTSQEQTVLKWANQKKTHIEIAGMLGITERTVRFHFNNIYNKYSVRDKVSAIQKAKVYGELV